MTRNLIRLDDLEWVIFNHQKDFHISPINFQRFLTFSTWKITAKKDFHYLIMFLKLKTTLKIIHHIKSMSPFVMTHSISSKIISTIIFWVWFGLVKKKDSQFFCFRHLMRCWWEKWSKKIRRKVELSRVIFYIASLDGSFSHTTLSLKSSIFFSSFSSVFSLLLSCCEWKMNEIKKIEKV